MTRMQKTLETYVYKNLFVNVFMVGEIAGYYKKSRRFAAVTAI